MSMMAKTSHSSQPGMDTARREYTSGPASLYTKEKVCTSGGVPSSQLSTRRTNMKQPTVPWMAEKPPPTQCHIIGTTSMDISPGNAQHSSPARRCTHIAAGQNEKCLWDYVRAPKCHSHETYKEVFSALSESGTPNSSYNGYPSDFPYSHTIP